MTDLTSTSTLRAVVERIVPADDYPSGWEAGVGDFLQRIVERDLADRAGLIRAGLGLLDAEARARHQNTPFARLPDAAQDALITDPVVWPTDLRWHNTAMMVGDGTRVFGAQAWRFCPEDFRMASTYGIPDGSSRGVGHAGRGTARGQRGQPDRCPDLTCSRPGKRPRAESAHRRPPGIHRLLAQPSSGPRQAE